MLRSSPARRLPIIAAALFMSLGSFTQGDGGLRPRIIRPPDDRADFFAATPQLQAIGNSVCAMIGTDMLTDMGNGTFSVNAQSLAEMFDPFCAGELFADQPTAANCTATLIAPDVIITAGHCLEEDGVRTDLNSFYFVFDYAVTTNNVNPAMFTADQVYRATEVLGLALVGDGANDWAVARLDRAVEGRTPVPVRSTGAIALGESVVAIGFGAGLPMKFSDNATIQTFVDFGFEADLDIIGGNSGGPIINAATGMIEGVLSADLAIDDYFQDGVCFRATVCPQDPMCQDGFTLIASVMIADFQTAIRAAIGGGGGGDDGNMGGDDGMGGDDPVDDGGMNGGDDPVDDGGVDNGNDDGVDDGGNDNGNVDFIDDDGDGIEDSEDDFIDLDGDGFDDEFGNEEFGGNAGAAPCGACGSGAGVAMIVSLFGWMGLRTHTRHRRR